MSAYDAGFRAAFDGIPASSNPFPSDTPSFEDWDEGHADCSNYDEESVYGDPDGDDYYDHLDGDFDSAMTSAGFGTDEDYCPCDDNEYEGD